jgi:rhomboid protease GluP
MNTATLTGPIQRFFRETSPMVRLIVVVNIVIYVVPYLLDQLGVVYKAMALTDLLLIHGAKDNIAIYQANQYYRFLTMMFLHGNLVHLLFNTFAIVQIGESVERMSDQNRFLGIYFVGGLVGGVASYLYSANPSVGASGAIFALIGAMGTFVWTNRSAYGEHAKQILGNIAFTAMINIFFGYSMPNIDNMAHIGGLLGGLVTGFLLMPRLTEHLTESGVVRQRTPLSWGWNGVIVLVALLFAIVALAVPAL